MGPSLNPEIQIREINRNSNEEIELVATRMRQTLIEVLGEEKGTALYSMEWLVDRVRWHLDTGQTQAKVFLIETNTGEIAAHAIARVESDENSIKYGYFSTIFVEPKSRNRGFAKGLLRHVEAWFRDIKMPKVVYNTAENHSKLIRLFEGHVYQITYRESHMIQLTKTLSGGL
jgi:GNAT superfamily N-acetyltransferase